MQKIKAKALTSILLMAMIMAVLPLTVNASTGYIRINVVAPASSPLGFTVPAGGNVNLHFGGVTWSGGQFYLLLSTNGFSDMTGDVYSATFDLVNLTDPVGVSTYPGPTGSGMSWKVGNNWVNGSIPLNIAGGAYYIKAFDGLSTSVAVTDTSITVVGTLTVKPTSGPGGAALLLRGFAFAANSLVNLTYYNTTSPFNKITIANLVPADALGQFNYSLTAPDLKLIVTPAGDSAFVPTPIIFNAKYSAGDGYNVTYNENPRGLKRINTSTATNLYGNATDIPVSKQVGETVRLIGLNFYPGTANILWDGATSIATATVNSTGGFDTVITVPTAGVGAHWVAIQDAGVSFFLVINVTPTLTLTPSSGPVGITVTAAGIGFPGSVGTNVYNITVAWTPYSGSVYAIAWGLTDASGQFTTTFVVPHEAGGNRTVTATANVTGTTASKIFYVTPTLVVSPSSFTNNGAVVNVYGSGLDPTGSYTPNIDNRYVGVDPYPSDYPTSIVANGTGDINLQFVAAGFTSGTHVFSLYKGGEILMPASNYVLFNVTGDNTQVLLTSINNTITGLSGLTGNSSSLLMSMDQKLSAINATVVAINGNMVTLATSVGTISTDLSAIKPQITSISSGVDTVKGAVATVQTSIGTLQTSLSSISGTLSSVSGTMGTISTSVGTITSSLSSIGTTVTSIKDGVATIQTDLGTLQGTVTATDGKVATIQTSIGTLQADVADVQTSVDAVPGAVNLPIWIAVILALVAAIASILCLVLMRRKIAG
jgi:archaellum component FlaC